MRQASTTASEIVSHNLSGWDSVTDSEAKRNELSAGVSSADEDEAPGFGVLGSCGWAAAAATPAIPVSSAAACLVGVRGGTVLSPAAGIAATAPAVPAVDDIVFVGGGS